MSPAQISISPVRRLRALTQLLLDSTTPFHALQPEIAELSELIGLRSAVHGTKDQDIAQGETLTANGLALSPTMAAMCLEDFGRTIVFLRGIDSAITDLRGEIQDRPLRILYAGCGPFAVLCLPLMSVLPPGSAEFTLLDIHPESVSSARAAIERFGLDDRVDAYLVKDASDYYIVPTEPPDLIVLEIMQACLESEPQVAIARHLLAQAPEALLVPERIRVRLDLVDLGREFLTMGSESEDAAHRRDRLPLGEVFCLDRNSIAAWAGNGDDQLPAASIMLPPDWSSRYQPMAFTEIIAYKGHVLGDYDSALTCPRSPTIKGPFQPGGVVEFIYELGRHPGLLGRGQPSGDSV